MNTAESGLFELPYGLLASLRAPRAQQYGTPRAGKIAADFEADAFVPASYQCDLLRDCQSTETPPANPDCLKRHSARYFNPLTVDPAIVV